MSPSPHGGPPNRARVRLLNPHRNLHLFIFPSCVFPGLLPITHLLFAHTSSPPYQQSEVLSFPVPTFPLFFCFLIPFPHSLCLILVGPFLSQYFLSLLPSPFSILIPSLTFASLEITSHVFVIILPLFPATLSPFFFNPPLLFS